MRHCCRAGKARKAAGGRTIAGLWRPCFGCHATGPGGGPCLKRGNRHTMYTRFQRWTASGVWARVLAAVQQDDALHTLLVDSTTVRAHQHASGARKKTGRKPWGAAAVA